MTLYIRALGFRCWHLVSKKRIGSLIAKVDRYTVYLPGHMENVHVFFMLKDRS